MYVQFKERWEKYGVIAELADQLDDKSPQFGKTALQKLVYILQEVYGVPCGYDYVLYNYGPYCGELSSDLTYFSLLEGVNVDWSGKGYEISPSKHTEQFIEKACDFLSRYEDPISKTVQYFGAMSAKDLELRTTIIFVSKQMTNQEEYERRRLVINKVNEIKPHFSIQEIENAYDELLALQVIE
jgi:uncharacterized protein YwgA